MIEKINLERRNKIKKAIIFSAVGLSAVALSKSGFGDLINDTAIGIGTSSKDELSYKLLNQDPVEIKELLKTEPLKYCEDYKRLIDEHLKTNLGKEMRGHLENIKATIDNNPTYFIKRKRVEMNICISKTADIDLPPSIPIVPDPYPTDVFIPKEVING